MHICIFFQGKIKPARAIWSQTLAQRYFTIVKVKLNRELSSCFFSPTIPSERVAWRNFRQKHLTLSRLVIFSRIGCIAIIRTQGRRYCVITGRIKSHSLLPFPPNIIVHNSKQWWRSERSARKLRGLYALLCSVDITGIDIGRYSWISLFYHDMRTSSKTYISTSSRRSRKDLMANLLRAVRGFPTALAIMIIPLIA